MTAGLRAIAALLLVVSVEAQSSNATAPGSIRGRVTTEGSRPLRRVQITLMTTSQGIGDLRISASTDGQGRYELRDVPPGSYRLRAVRAGFITVEYGQRTVNQPGLTVDVRPGHAVERIDFALARGAVLAGRLFDDAGEPMQGARVEAQELRYVGGRRAPFPGGTALTDDNGEFRISGLQPGLFYVRASSSEMWLDDEGRTLGFAPTYFPGGAPRDAQVVTLGAGQERLNLDFSLSASRVARISGAVFSAAGAPAAGQRVVLATEYHEIGVVSTAGMRNIAAGVDGSFEFVDVAPGHYRLASQGQDDGVAVLHLDVTGEDIGGLTMRRQTGSSVSGTITTDAGATPDFPPGRLRMAAVTTDPDRKLPTPVFLPSLVVKPDWTFNIANIAGPHVFRIVGLPEGWLLKSVRINETNVTDSSVDVPVGRKDISGVEITLTSRSGAVAGDVVDRKGKPAADATVVVFADDRDRWGPGTRFVKVARSSADGQFVLTGLPAGRYRALASLMLAEGQWEDAEFLAAALDGAAAVTVSEGARQRVSLRLAEKP
jgi:protocatechuate 3,4-dioxygenase beta subunit